MDDEIPDGSAPELTPRPTRRRRRCDLPSAQRTGRPLCGRRRLRDHPCSYARPTGDIDLLIDTDLANEALVYQALEILPDKAVRELDPGDVAKYVVVRVADEVLVDLMRSAAGIEYAEAARDVIIYEVEGVPIPFCLPAIALADEGPHASRKG